MKGRGEPWELVWQENLTHFFQDVSCAHTLLLEPTLIPANQYFPLTHWPGVLRFSSESEIRSEEGRMLRGILFWKIQLCHGFSKSQNFFSGSKTHAPETAKWAEISRGCVLKKILPRCIKKRDLQKICKTYFYFLSLKTNGNAIIIWGIYDNSAKEILHSFLLTICQASKDGDIHHMQKGPQSANQQDFLSEWRNFHVILWKWW